MAIDGQERDKLIRMYAEGPDVLLAAWNEVPVEARMWRPADGIWSAYENVIHCSDSETIAATRIRFLISEPNPIIVGYDQDEWIDVFRYHDRDIDLAFDAIRAVRAFTVPIILAMPDAAWGATGSHTRSGRFTAEDWLQNYGVHLHGHAEQIRENVRIHREQQ